MNYKCLQKETYQLNKYLFVTLREEDILNIKEWRNAQMSILRQNNVLTDSEQINYFQRVVKPTFTAEQPEMVLFSILEDGECVGYGGLTHIDWIARRAEISFLIETNRNENLTQVQKDFGNFLKFLKFIAFQELGLNRLFSETYEVRPYIVAILEESGFKYEGRLREHVQVNSHFTDSVVHGLLRNEYMASDKECF